MLEQLTVGAKASDSPPSLVTIDLTVAALPEGNAIIPSPGMIVPDVIFPAKRLKSEFGRITYWTGKRKSSTCTMWLHWVQEHFTP